MITLIEKLEENKFITRQKTEDNKTISSVIVDFNPVLSKLKVKEEIPFCLVHNRARPLSNKALWRWGFLWKGDYRLVTHYETELVCSFSLEREDLETPDNPPTWVVCYWNVEVEFKNDVAFIKQVANKNHE